MKQIAIIFISALALFIVPWQFIENTKTLESQNDTELAVANEKQELPAIKEIKSTLQLADVSFYPELVNEPLNALDYKGKRKVAANTGVYLADFIYTKSFGSNIEVNRNYGAIMELSKSAGLNHHVTDIILERYQDENNSIEELSALLQNALSNSNIDISQDEQDQLFAYLVMGNYIEKLYVTSSIMVRPKQLELPKETEAMLKRNLLAYVSQQSVQLQQISDLLNAFEGDEKDELVRAEFNKLIDSYEVIESQRNEILSLPANEIFKVNEVQEVYSQIKSIREKIIA